MNRKWFMNLDTLARHNPQITHDAAFIILEGNLRLADEGDGRRNPALVGQDQEQYAPEAEATLQRAARRRGSCLERTVEQQVSHELRTSREEVVVAEVDDGDSDYGQRCQRELWSSHSCPP
jgi:hypothetical protein